MLKLNTGLASINKQIAVYPNPFQDKILINGIENENTWMVFDLTGKKVFEKNVDGSNTELQLDFLEKGVYVLRAKNYLPIKIVKY